jgi:exopolyphosphatase/guanosine-5'-triphosphate,3'-diphosphate pyrophosphatase
MIHWTDAFFSSSQLHETAEEKRLRHAACLYGDIGWRTSPDHRAGLAMDLLANTPTMGVDHAGRAYLGMAVAYRHIGMDEDVSPLIRGLATPRLMDRARIMGALQRVAYIISASTPGVLPRVKLTCARGELLLTLPPDLADLAGERLNGRLKQLARLLGRKPMMAIG